MKNGYFHATALVESEQIGDGTRIWAFTHIMKGASIGANCNIGEHCFIESGAAVGNNVTIKNGNELWEGVTLADGVFVGPKVAFTNDLHPRSPRLPQAAGRYEDRKWLAPTMVKEGASIGAGAIVLAGRTIGEFALVGAGAVVSHDVPAHALVVGVPARVVGWVCECGCDLRFFARRAVCKDCGRQFVLDGKFVHLKRGPAIAA